MRIGWILIIKVNSCYSTSLYALHFCNENTARWWFVVSIICQVKICIYCIKKNCLCVEICVELCTGRDKNAAGWGQKTANKPWRRHQMETFTALLALCEENSPVTNEFSSQRPVKRSFDVFIDLHLKKRLSKQSIRWWFETPLRSLLRHCNAHCWLPHCFLSGPNGYSNRYQNKRCNILYNDVR